jgi:hypothetical protein
MSIILSPDELAAVTQYRRPADQLRELHRQGFHRARLGRAGGVILERVHYDAVSAGRLDAMNAPGFRPQVRLA